MSDNQYISGVFRGDGGDKMVTHLYKGTMSDPGHPMCGRGWQRKYFNKDGKLIDWEYSIFRNNHSEAGMCKVCERRAAEGLPPIEKPKAKYDKRNPNHFIEKETASNHDSLDETNLTNG